MLPKRRKKIKRISIKDVAEKAGVSITTVSRVINKVPTVKSYNRHKVEEVIKRLGYRPDISARRLAGGRIYTIGLIIPAFEDMFHTYYVTQVMRGTCQTATRSGLDVLIHLTDKTKKQDLWDTHLENLSFCSGLIFADLQRNEELLKIVMKQEIPTVVINYMDEKLKACCIAVDNKGGAIKAVEHMISLGHTEIATITGDLSIQAARDRLEGYKEGLLRHGLECREGLIKVGDFSPQSAKKAIMELLDHDPFPTGIFVASDEMAVEVVKVLLSKNFMVPRDITIVGFDDSWFSTQSPVPLTTIRQPLDIMGSLAVDKVKRAIGARRLTTLTKIILPTELIVRDSSAPPLTKKDFY